MNIKRIVAQDMRQAIRLVREQLGPEAVILSNKSIADGVELTAAVDLHQSELATEVLDSRIAARPEPTRAPQQSASVAGTADAERGHEDPIGQLRREMTTIREMMRHELGELSWLDLGARSPERRELVRRLLTLGFSTELARQATGNLDAGEDLDAAWRQVLLRIAESLPVCRNDAHELGGNVVVVGPTGVGKTTTLAKLAARFALKHGSQNVGLVSIDNYRIGAQEQLHTYGRILDVPVRLAASSEQLDDVLQEMHPRRLVLIDTAGMGAETEQFEEQRDLLAGSAHDLTRLLVLSATTERAALERAVELFGGLQPDAAILTKLDESASLGGALTATIGSGLPLAFITDGQRVPEDLHPAHACELVNRAAEFSSVLNEDSTYLAFASGDHVASARA